MLRVVTDDDTFMLVNAYSALITEDLRAPCWRCHSTCGRHREGIKVP